LKSLERRQEEETLDSKQKKKLESKIHAARVNVNYTIYYPLTEKYIALYPKSKSSDKDGADSGAEPEPEQKTVGDDAKPPMWAIIEKCMEEGTLDQLREGKLNIGADGKQIAPSSVKVATVADTKKIKKESKDSKGLKVSKGPKDSKKDIKKEQPARTEDKSKYDSKYDNMNRRDRRREQAKEQAKEEAKKAAARAQAGEEDSDGGFFE
jgi:hypothetical protein